MAIMTLDADRRFQMLLHMVSCVIKACFEEDEIAMMQQNNLIGPAVVAAIRNKRKNLATKVMHSLNSRWPTEDTRDLVLRALFEVGGRPYPMRMQGWGDDDNMIGRILDEAQDIIGGAMDYLISNNSVYDVDYITAEGEKVKNISSAEVDRAVVTMTAVREPMKLARFLTPDTERGILFVDTPY